MTATQYASVTLHSGEHKATSHTCTHMNTTTTKVLTLECAMCLHHAPGVCLVGLGCDLCAIYAEVGEHP